ncbi:MAG: response regulator [bacterium]|nr:response regulator [bacterium]
MIPRHALIRPDAALLDVGLADLGQVALVLGLVAAGAGLLHCRRSASRARAEHEATIRDLVADRERLAAVVEAGRYGIFDLDLATGRLDASPAFYAAVGNGDARPEHGQAWLALVHPDDSARLDAARRAGSGRGGPGYACEVRLQRTDGSSRWVLEQGRGAAHDEAGCPLRLAGTVRDITARKRVEQQLAMRGRMAAAFLAARGDVLLGDLGAMLQELLEAPCSCVGMLDEQGRLRLACNGADGSRHATTTMDADALPAALRRVLDAEGPLVTEGQDQGTPDQGTPDQGLPRLPLLAVRLASGERVFGLVAVAGRTRGFGDDDAATIAGIAADLAPLVQSRLEAEAADKQAAQAQKMQALGVMAGGIAHDFNNILQAILGFSTLARQDAHDPARLATDLDRVQRATVRGRDLVQRILHFSRPADAEATPLDPLPLLEDLAIELRATQPDSVRVVTSFAPDCGHVRAGSEHLRQALANLAANAAQAMDSRGGTLTLAAAPWRVNATDARFPADWRGREVVAFRIGDTGPGIAEEIRARLFDPFFTTRAVGEGTGLGLSVVHGLVTGLGGRVVIECPATGGTVASVYLPRVDAHGHPPAPADTLPASSLASRRGRVLFVDDDPEIRDLAVTLLGRAGLEVETAQDGLQACERLARDPSGFDVVVTDQYMPGLTGRELALRVAALRPDLPVVLVTGLDEPADAAVAGALVFREVVTKPFFGQSLILAVRRALDRARVGAEPEATP